MKNTNNCISRRSFMSTMGYASLGTIAGGALAGCSGHNASEKLRCGNKADEPCFVTKPKDIAERIEMVKIALLGMQLYNWEQGVAAQAMLELGEDKWVVSLARAAIMRQEEGMFSLVGDYNLMNDSASVGEAVLYAGEITQDPLYSRAADEMIEVMFTTEHKSEKGILYHRKNPEKFFASDSFYMAPPFLAAAGYYNEAIKQIDGFREALWNDKDKLYSHMWDDGEKKFERQDYWGVGNGWTAAGITRVIEHLPENWQKQKKKLAGYVKELIDGCLVHMREDGLFYNIVDKHDTFVETNLSQMISYSIFRGVTAGWLDASYLEPAGKMRKAAHTKVDRYGLVWGVCGVPDFDSSSIAPEGQAFFLLMEAAARDLESCTKYNLSLL